MTISTLSILNTTLKKEVYSTKGIRFYWVRTHSCPRVDFCFWYISHASLSPALHVGMPLTSA